jgi:hypothetical protein
LLSGIVLLVLLVVLQYVAGKFFDVLDRLNRATGGSLPSTALCDAVALLSMVVGLAQLFGSVEMAVRTSIVLVIVGIASLIVHGYLACVALNPATLNISIAPVECDPSEEAIGVLMFLLKALLRTVPVVFGVGVLGGTIVMGDACRQALFGAEGLSWTQTTASAARGILVFSAALPFIAYLLFLLFSLAIDVCRALLHLPGRPDRRGEQDIV